MTKPFPIHPNQIHKWKIQALEDFAQLFEDDRKGERAREVEHEKQINELYAEIGRLSAQPRSMCVATLVSLSSNVLQPQWPPPEIGGLGLFLSRNRILCQ